MNDAENPTTTNTDAQRVDVQNTDPVTEQQAPLANRAIGAGWIITSSAIALTAVLGGPVAPVAIGAAGLMLALTILFGRSGD